MTPRRAYAPILTAAVLAVAGCSSSPTTTPDTQAIATTPTAGPAATAKLAAAPSPTCDLTKEPDVLVWSKVPGLPDSAQELGGWNPSDCKSSIDRIMSAEPTGAGYCAKIAMASDNPGYNPDATPAQPLRHVIEEVGAGC